MACLAVPLLLAACVQTPKTNPILSDEKFMQFLATKHIRVIAPSSAVSSAENTQLNAIIPAEVVRNSAEWTGSPIPFHATTDEKRWAALKEALYDPNIKIIWTLRGGYGSARLIQYLLTLKPPAQKKVVIGYSDTTALHLFLSQRWGWKTIHGAGFKELLNAEKDPNNFKIIMDILSGQAAVVEVNDLVPLNFAAKRTQKISGALTGGNLTLMQTSIATPWQLQARDKIVFIEDVGVRGGQIDRTLYHLKEAGLFNGVKAIVFGEFEFDTLGSLDNLFSLKKFAAETNIPVFKTNQFGHDKSNVPLVYNAQAEIKISEDTAPKQLQRFSLQMNLS